ncbi:hypothetical protein [Brevibacterium sp.]|uniref:hypothetical protein n=1 Tax=Brevibacterium sp. TaxID=1701 RepID=UPI00281163DC|nr:hypothetical protein [Brevibacterium sp.]
MAKNPTPKPDTDPGDAVEPVTVQPTAATPVAPDKTAQTTDPTLAQEPETKTDETDDSPKRITLVNADGHTITTGHPAEITNLRARGYTESK